MRENDWYKKPLSTGLVKRKAEVKKIDEFCYLAIIEDLFLVAEGPTEKLALARLRGFIASHLLALVQANVDRED